MIKLVAKYCIAVTQQRRRRPHVRHISSGKQQRAGQSGEAGQRFFQRMMRRRVPADKMRRAGANPIFPCTLACCTDQLRMIGKAEIIIAAKREVLTPANRNMGALRTLENQTVAEQILLFAAVQLFA